MTVQMVNTVMMTIKFVMISVKVTVPAQMDMYVTIPDVYYPITCSVPKITIVSRDSFALTIKGVNDRVMLTSIV